MKTPSLIHCDWTNSNCRPKCAPTNAKIKPRSAPSSSIRPQAEGDHRRFRDESCDECAPHLQWTRHADWCAEYASRPVFSIRWDRQLHTGTHYCVSGRRPAPDHRAMDRGRAGRRSSIGPSSWRPLVLHRRRPSNSLSSTCGRRRRVDEACERRHRSHCDRESQAQFSGAGHLVCMSQHKLARLQGLLVRICSGNATAFDRRMADPIAESKRFCLGGKRVTILAPNRRDSRHCTIGFAGAV